jgi:hypothetical protein
MSSGGADDRLHGIGAGARHPPTAWGTAASRSALLAISFLVLFGLAILPVLQAKIPPLDDYINHLARMHVIAIDGRDALLARFYTIDWKLIPNLAEDLIVPPLARGLGVYVAGKIFVLAYMTLLLTGPHAIHYALYRRLSLGPLVAFLFIYNQLNGWGLVNYLFGVGLSLWGIAAWIALRRSSAVLRGAVSLAFVLALFVSHLSALGLYGLALLGHEAAILRAGDPAIRRRVPDILALVLPFLVVPVLLLLGPDGDAGGPVVWELPAKLQGFWLSIKTHIAIIDIPVGALIAALAFWAWRRGILRVHPAVWWFLAAAIPVYLAMPTEIMSAWGADVRLPIGMLFIIIGFLDWTLPTPRARRAFVLVVGGLAVLRIAVVEIVWQRLDAVTAEFERSLPLIPPGSKVLAAQATNPPQLRLLHYLPSLATIERSSLAADTFANPRQQILSVNEPYTDMAGGYHTPLSSLDQLLAADDTQPPTRHGVYWSRWRHDYDYLYVLWTAGAENADPGGLETVYVGRDFTLYRIPHPG